MSIKNKIRSIRWIISKHGIRSVFIYSLRKYFWRDRENKSCRLFLFVLDKPVLDTKLLINTRSHVFRFAELEEIQYLKDEGKWDLSEQDIKAYKNGDRCLLHYDADILVGYSWISASPLINIKWGFHFNLPDNALYNYKGFTAPEYRGRGYQPLRHLKLLEHAKNIKHRTLFAFVDQLNLNSLKGVKKSGYKKIGVLRGKVSRNNIISFKLSVAKKFWSDKRRSYYWDT